MRTFVMILMLPGMALGAFGQGSDVIHVRVDGFKHVMDSLRDEVIIDLRTPDELKQGKIPGAMVIDYFGSDFESSIEKLDRTKVYLLYCAGGGRSGETSQLMQKLGFRRLYNLEDGFNGWLKRKMPVEK